MAALQYVLLCSACLFITGSETKSTDINAIIEEKNSTVTDGKEVSKNYQENNPVEKVSDCIRTFLMTFSTLWNGKQIFSRYSHEWEGLYEPMSDA